MYFPIDICIELHRRINLVGTLGLDFFLNDEVPESFEPGSTIYMR